MGVPLSLKKFFDCRSLTTRSTATIVLAIALALFLALAAVLLSPMKAIAKKRSPHPTNRAINGSSPTIQNANNRTAIANFAAAATAMNKRSGLAVSASQKYPTPSNKRELPRSRLLDGVKLTCDL
jgi:hypothetical protein